jgi:uroporphyrinogen decarboxylase
VEIISKRVGNEVLVVNHLGVPFGDAAFMVGLKEWILALYRKPQLAEKAMEWCLSQTLEYAKALVEAGTEAFYMEEIWASTDIISPSLYEKFAFPYECMQIKKLRKFGIPLILSFCGNPMPILDKIIETKPDAHHFEESKKGFIVDIFKIREKLRGKTCFFMPVDAINLLPSSDLEAIRKNVTEIVTRTAEGGGVVLGTGCPLMKDTSPESLDMMIRTAREVGKYPISA